MYIINKKICNSFLRFLMRVCVCGCLSVDVCAAVCEYTHTYTLQFLLLFYYLYYYVVVVCLANDENLKKCATQL